MTALRPFAAGLLLAAAALAAGPLAALVVSPLALVLALQAFRAPAPGQGRRLLGLGSAAALASLALAPLGSWLLGLTALALALASAGLGLERAVEEEPLEGGSLPALALDELRRLAPRSGLRQDAPGLLARRLVRAAERRRDAGWDRDPGAAHAHPPVLDKPSLAPVAWPGGGGAERLRAPSEFVPYDPEVAAGFLAATRGRTLEAWLLRRPGGRRPTLLCVAPAGLRAPRVLSRLFATRQLDARGFDLALVPLAAGLGADPLHATAVLARAVWDLRRLAGWLRSEGAPVLGVAGIGEGASAAGLLAGVDSRLVCAVLALPVVSPAARLWRDLPGPRRDAWAAAGIDEVLLESVMAPASPLRISPRVPHAGRLLLGARADRIVPAAQIHALHQHWQAPRLHWLPGSRTLPGGLPEARALVEAHLVASLGAAGQGEAVMLSHFRRAVDPTRRQRPEPG